MKQADLRTIRAVNVCFKRPLPVQAGCHFKNDKAHLHEEGGTRFTGITCARCDGGFMSTVIPPYNAIPWGSKYLTSVIDDQRFNRGRVVAGLMTNTSVHACFAYLTRSTLHVSEFEKRLEDRNCLLFIV